MGGKAHNHQEIYGDLGKTRGKGNTDPSPHLGRPQGRVQKHWSRKNSVRGVAPWGLNRRNFSKKLTEKGEKGIFFGKVFLAHKPDFQELPRVALIK